MKDELTAEKLKGVKMWITAGPREKFTASEVKSNNQYILDAFRSLSTAKNASTVLLNKPRKLGLG